MNTKQVIVIRKDLKMRRGKEIAQGSHASMAWLTRRINMYPTGQGFTEAEKEWMTGCFTKVVLQVDSLDEIERLHKDALNAGVIAFLITDAGRTEFNGVPTVTALGIGPDVAELIDPITRHLTLY